MEEKRETWKAKLISSDGLCNFEENEFITLPRLESVTTFQVPKDYNEDVCSDYLITKSTKKLAERMLVLPATKRGGMRGTYVHGAHGCGKSTSLLMTAAVGWANNLLVQYVPRGDIVANRKTADDCALCLLDNFRLVNEDVLRKYADCCEWTDDELFALPRMGDSDEKRLSRVGTFFRSATKTLLKRTRT